MNSYFLRTQKVFWRHWKCFEPKFLLCLVLDGMWMKEWKCLHKLWLFQIAIYVMHCAIWYHLYLKNVKNAQGGVLLLVKSATLLKVTLLHGRFTFFTLFKLCKWYQILQSIAYNSHTEFLNRRMTCLWHVLSLA